jgi:hypothetical protein
LKIESPSGPLKRSVTLNDEVIALYGSGSHVTFQVNGGLTPPIHDCKNAVLIGYAKNPSANFKLPAANASLVYNVYCLECISILGRSFTRKVIGVVEGKELRGEHAHIYGIKRTQDRFGLGAKAGATGMVRLDKVSMDNCE